MLVHDHLLNATDHFGKQMNSNVSSPTLPLQASLSVLLEEKWKLESRVLELEEELREAHKAVRRGNADAIIAAAAAGAAEYPVDDDRVAGVSIEAATPPLTPRPSTAAPTDHGKTTLSH